MNVNEKWMRPRTAETTHAIDEPHLAQARNQEWERVYPLAVTCLPLSTKDLAEDDDAPKCPACQRRVNQLKQQQP